MKETNHPEMHINKEPSNDFIDVALGYGVFFVAMLVIAVIATLVKLSM